MSLSQFLQFPQKTLTTKENTWLQNIVVCLGGVILLSLLAQIAIPLPFTPVPITGQTFAVTLLALTLGRNQGIAVVMTYLLAGALGLPVFAQAKSGLVFGSTLGYLIGMLLSSVLIGTLADRGWTTSLKKTFAAAFIGSVIVYTSGLIVLAFFVPANMLLMAGFIPFLPSLVVQYTLASFLAYRLKKKCS